MQALTALSATQIVAGTTSGDFSVEEVVRAVLDRIEERDPLIRAWQTVNPEYALRQARVLDKRGHRGPLHGVPIGVKDVIDTAELPTRMGSPIYEANQPGRDAKCVEIVRQADAVILGKTVTAEFAGTTATVTRNPHNIQHTAGGSSSGSAAAVADAMVPLAFGTQTGGSILRPASFCGVFGFKPSFDSYDLTGVWASAPSFDTLGLLARSIDDIELVHGVLTKQEIETGRTVENPPRIGICRTHLWGLAEPDAAEVFEEISTRLSNSHAVLTEVVLPDGAEKLTEHRAVINARERALGLKKEWQEHREQLSEPMRRTCERGFAVKADEYRNAIQATQAYRALMPQLFSDIDVLLTPAVNGEAPLGHDYAGDPRFQEIWTMLHVPAISLPIHRGRRGLPIGVQLVGAPGHECLLLRTARWVMDQLLNP